MRADTSEWFDSRLNDAKRVNWSDGRWFADVLQVFCWFYEFLLPYESFAVIRRHRRAIIHEHSHHFFVSYYICVPQSNPFDVDFDLNPVCHKSPSKTKPILSEAHFFLLFITRCDSVQLTLFVCVFCVLKQKVNAMRACVNHNNSYSGLSTSSEWAARARASDIIS